MRLSPILGVLLLSAASASLTPAPAAAETLRWAASRDIGSLDPDSFGDTFTLAFLNHVYEALVRYDENLKIEPALASSWEIVEPTVWRFHLRPACVSMTAPRCRPTTWSPRSAARPRTTRR